MTTPSPAETDVDTEHMRWLIGRERAVSDLAIHAEAVAPWLDRLERALTALDQARAQLASGRTTPGRADWDSAYPNHADQAMQIANN